MALFFNEASVRVLGRGTGLLDVMAPEFSEKLSEAIKPGF